MCTVSYVDVYMYVLMCTNLFFYFFIFLKIINYIICTHEVHMSCMYTHILCNSRIYLLCFMRSHCATTHVLCIYIICIHAYMHV